MNALSPQQGLLQSPPSLAEPNRVISTAPGGLGCGGQSSLGGQMNRHARGQATSLSVAGRRKSDATTATFIPAIAKTLSTPCETFW